MSEEIRKSGIDIIGDIPWGSHFCQFYRSARDLLDLLVPYFAAGLAANEFCMWITSEPVDNADAEKALAAAVPDLARHVREGRIEIIPHDRWYLAGGTFDADRVLKAWSRKLEEARVRGFEGLRLSGNTFWLEQKDWRAFTDYEAAVNEVIGQSRMLALCTYSLERCGANEVLDVVRNHRFALVRREGTWELVEGAEITRARRTERRLAQFPQQNPYPVLRIGEARDLLFANPPALRFLAAMGSRSSGSLPPALEDLVARAFRQDGLVQADVEDGAGHTYWLTGVRPAGESYVNLYAYDTTARARAERALRESEAKYRVLFEAMAEGFALYELIDDENGRPVDWRVLEVNEAYTRHTGLPRDEIVGRRVSEVFPVSVGDYLPIFAKVVETGEPVDFETYAKAVGRHQHIVTFPAGGRRFANLIEDITERRRTEVLRQALAEQERLRLGAAVELAPEAVVMAEPDGRIVYVNAAFESFNRLAKAAAIGRNYFELVAADPRSVPMREALTGGLAWKGRITLTRPGERAAELEILATPLQDPPGILITERDVTQELILQDQVRQAQKMESLGTLAGGIAHDFNNILGAIVINSELALLDTAEDCPARESLPLVLRAAERGKELVRQITAFSRQQEWGKSDLLIASVVREALALFRATLPATVTLNAAIGAEKATVLGHPAQIHQIVMNLCQNAALAMRDKGGLLDVRLDTTAVDEATAARHADLRPGPYVRLTVADSGCGMPREVLDRIFEPFFTTRSQGEGSGLGLAVVHGIVRSFGGAITVASEPGQGSTFTVFLPLLGEGRGLGEAAAGPAVEPGSGRILLVDDDTTQLQGLGRMLETLGYEVTTRASGPEAKETFARDPAAFDLVITDQTMPRMSGIELAQSLSRVRPDIPIILNTGFSEKINGETVGRNGIRAFLMKPFTISELSALIRRVLKGGR